MTDVRTYDPIDISSLEFWVGEPEYLTANLIYGIKRMPCTL